MWVSVFSSGGVTDYQHEEKNTVVITSILVHTGGRSLSRLQSMGCGIGQGTVQKINQN